MMLRTPPPKRRPPPSPPLSPPSDVPLLSPKRPRFLPPQPPPLQLLPLHKTQLLSSPPNDNAIDLDHFADPHGDVDATMRCSYRCRQMVKSELLETLDHQQKIILELSSKVDSLETRARIADAEEQDSLDHAKSLEQEVSASSAREKVAHEKFILELKQAEERFCVQLKRCNDLEMKLQQEMRQRAEAERKANASDSQLASLKGTSDKAAEACKREIQMLKENLQRVQKDADFNISRTKAENSSKKGRLQFFQAEVQALKAQIEELQNQLSKSLDEKRNLEQRLAMVSTRVSSSGNQELEAMVNNLKNELKHCESDVAEARKLKQLHMNADLLKEKLESEKQRADRAEASLEDREDLNLVVKSLEGELQSWRNLIHELPDVEACDDIPRKIADLQREAMNATAKAAEAAAQASELRVTLETAENRRCEAERDLSLTRDELNEMVLKNKKLEWKVQLLLKERDGYKSILASYDEEEAAMMKQNKEGATTQVSAEMPENAKGKRIQELEALIATFQKETDVLRSELTKAEMKLGRGDYNPSSTKVVHLVENLDVDTEKQALLSEIQSLREKLDSCQKTKINSGRGDNGNVELLLLQEQVNSLEKREARYKKVFAEKISVFRQACCLLFGYTVQMNEEQHSSTGMMITLFTLQSIYAQNEDEKLEFQFESDHMNLLANEYTSSPDIERMVDVYLQKFKSIPAFTANLTSELFNKATIG